MRVKILSDLHLNAYDKFQYIPLDEEVCILAGDIAEGSYGVLWAQKNIPENIRVLYVPGNHEYYGHEYFKLNEVFRTLNRMDTHVKVLIDDTETINGVKFVGSTLWTDFNLYGTYALSSTHWKHGLNDSRYMKYQDRPIEAQDFINMNAQALSFIRENPGDVLITHYCPNRSVHSRYQGDPYTPGFASNIPEDIVSPFKLHAHGHTHSSFDYISAHYLPRVICNPKGYRVENYDEFDPDLIVDIERKEDGTIYLS